MNSCPTPSSTVEPARSVAKIKNHAGKLRKAARRAGQEMTWGQALKASAISYGYANYRHAVRELPALDPLKTPTN